MPRSGSVVNHVPSPDEAAIRDHVAMLHKLAKNTGKEGLLVVASYGEEPTGKKVSRPVEHFAIGNVDGMVSAIVGLTRQRHINVYVPTAIFRTDLAPGKKGREQEVVALLAVVADLDSDTGKAGNLPREPSYKLETSEGNFQAFFVLAQPVSNAVAKQAGEELAKFTGCDHGTKDISHIWRVPGTLNWPNKAKLERGRSETPQLVTVAQPWSGEVIDAAEIIKACSVTAPPVTPPVTVPRRGGGKLFEIVSAPGGKDRSADFFKAVQTAKECGVSADDLEALMRDHPNGCAAKYLTPIDRLHKEIDAAWNKPGTIDTNTAWPVPAPLPAGLKPVLQFDLSVLPRTIGPWVEDVADLMQCPVDFVAIPAIVALGSVIGSRIGVRPQADTDWTELPNLWGCIIGRPGVMKSPAISKALKPLKELEAKAAEANMAAIKEYEHERETTKLKKEAEAARFKNVVKKGGGAAELRSFDEPERPAQKRYMVTDTSYEKLGDVMFDNPCGVLSYRDEMVSLLKSLEDERNSTARGFYLQAWNGNLSYTFDRIGRGHLHIETACLSMIGSTQPGKIASFVRAVTGGGEGDDGMLQRFSLIVWPDQSGWKEVDRQPDSIARRAAQDVFNRLAEMTPEGVEAERDVHDKIPFLRFSPEGLRLFRDWRADFETGLRTLDNPALETHISKHRKAIPGFALIHHLASGGVGEITAMSVEAAIKFAGYLESHARRLYGSGRVADADAAELILTKIRKGDLVDGFTARDVKQRDWSGLTSSWLVDAALGLLVEYDWLSSTSSAPVAGGREKVSYRVNPAIFQETPYGGTLKTLNRSHGESIEGFEGDVGRGFFPNDAPVAPATEALLSPITRESTIVAPPSTEPAPPPVTPAKAKKPWLNRV